MFDNIGTALVQAVGFFAVFGFFVYQLLSDGKNNNNPTPIVLSNKSKKSKDFIDKPKKSRWFSKKSEPINEEVKPKKNGLFGRKKTIDLEEKPKKKGWFN